METYTCAECENDHYKIWSDFATMIWVHKNSCFSRHIESLMTTKARIKKAKGKMATMKNKYTEEFRKMQKKIPSCQLFNNRPALAIENQAVRLTQKVEKLTAARIELAIELLKDRQIEKADKLIEACRKRLRT